MLKNGELQTTLRFLKKDKGGPGPPVETPVAGAYNAGSLLYIIPINFTTARRKFAAEIISALQSGEVTESADSMLGLSAAF
jgi:hypothetical protein